MVPASKSSTSGRGPRLHLRRRAAGAAFLTAFGAAFGATPGRAVADGAFPDSMQLLVPGDHPHRIILATNFGLLISENDGATWEWSCEARDNDVAILYQRAAAPSDRIFSVLAINGMVYSMVVMTMLISFPLGLAWLIWTVRNEPIELAALPLLFTSLIAIAG